MPQVEITVYVMRPIPFLRERDGGWGGGGCGGIRVRTGKNETNDHKRRRDGKKAEGDSERRGKKMQQNGKLEGRRWKGIE